MASRRRPAVIYWDSSAVLSALFSDDHSERAHAESRRRGIHLLSTLGVAEVRAVVSRRRRERLLTRTLADSAVEVLRTGPWRSLRASPTRDAIATLADRWPLRGADLWHLALAKVIQGARPEAQLLTFDERLLEAARGEELTG